MLRSSPGRVSPLAYGAHLPVPRSWALDAEPGEEAVVSRRRKAFDVRKPIRAGRTAELMLDVEPGCRRPIVAHESVP